MGNISVKFVFLMYLKRGIDPVKQNYLLFPKCLSIVDEIPELVDNLKKMKCKQKARSSF